MRTSLTRPSRFWSHSTDMGRSQAVSSTLIGVLRRCSASAYWTCPARSFQRMPPPATAASVATSRAGWASTSRARMATTPGAFRVLFVRTPASWIARATRAPSSSEGQGASPMIRRPMSARPVTAVNWPTTVSGSRQPRRTSVMKPSKRGLAVTEPNAARMTMGVPMARLASGISVMNSPVQLEASGWASGSDRPWWIVAWVSSQATSTAIPGPPSWAEARGRIGSDRRRRGRQGPGPPDPDPMLGQDAGHRPGGALGVEGAVDVDDQAQAAAPRQGGRGQAPAPAHRRRRPAAGGRRGQAERELDLGQLGQAVDGPGDLVDHGLDRLEDRADQVAQAPEEARDDADDPGHGGLERGERADQEGGQRRPDRAQGADGRPDDRADRVEDRADDRLEGLERARQEGAQRVPDRPDDRVHQPLDDGRHRPEGEDRQAIPDADGQEEDRGQPLEDAHDGRDHPLDHRQDRLEDLGDDPPERLGSLPEQDDGRHQGDDGDDHDSDGVRGQGRVQEPLGGGHDLGPGGPDRRDG